MILLEKNGNIFLKREIKENSFPQKQSAWQKQKTQKRECLYASGSSLQSSVLSSQKACLFLRAVTLIKFTIIIIITFTFIYFISHLFILLHIYFRFQFIFSHLLHTYSTLPLSIKSRCLRSLSLGFSILISQLCLFLFYFPFSRCMLYFEVFPVLYIFQIFLMKFGFLGFAL